MDRTEIGHSGEGRLLVGHGPRDGERMGAAVDRSFVEQPGGERWPIREGQTAVGGGFVVRLWWRGGGG